MLFYHSINASSVFVIIIPQYRYPNEWKYLFFVPFWSNGNAVSHSIPWDVYDVRLFTFRDLGPISVQINSLGIKYLSLTQQMLNNAYSVNWIFTWNVNVTSFWFPSNIDDAFLYLQGPKWVNTWQHFFCFIFTQFTAAQVFHFNCNRHRIDID